CDAQRLPAKRQPDEDREADAEPLQQRRRAEVELLHHARVALPLGPHGEDSSGDTALGVAHLAAVDALETHGARALARHPFSPGTLRAKWNRSQRSQSNAGVSSWSTSTCT